jgi:hypothetical protein
MGFVALEMGQEGHVLLKKLHGTAGIGVRSCFVQIRFREDHSRQVVFNFTHAVNRSS